ncbi:MAG: OmpA family protein [Prolixibacteraceae bacterium]|nr:OmpA family protein [Prolixibacteraceae bacterium]
MRTTVSLLSSLLFTWISIASYIYVCKIRNDCYVAETKEEDTGVIETPVSDPQPVAKVEEAVPMPASRTIFFDFNKCQAEITTEDFNSFELIKNYLEANPGKKVLVTGHSDNIGSDPVNDQVSQLRAGYIAQKLAEAGIASTAIEVKSESDNKPIGDNSTREGRDKNRRVEIIIQ